MNGRTAKYLFAATHLSKALAFAFDYYGGEIFSNGGLENSTEEYAIICNRSKTFGTPRRIQILSFLSEGFEEAWPGTDSRQAVSTESLPVGKTCVVLETSDVNDLMRHGLQLFSTDKTVEQLFEEDIEAYFAKAGGPRQGLAGLVETKGFYWENRIRNINPDAELLEKLGPYAADHISPETP